MRRWWNRQGGFTLAEMLVGLSILAVVTSSLGTAMFHSLGTQQRVIDDGRAINEIRKGLGWIAEDVKMAQSTDLVDGGPASSSATFTWTDEFSGAGASHSSAYALTNGDLVRTYDGASHPIARWVVSASFSLVNRTVTAQVETKAKPDGNRTASVKTVMRAGS